MSHSKAPRPSPGDAAASEFPSVPPADELASDFGRPAPPTLDSRIEREIERSERASAALMATRAMARAAFTDSQLAAEDAEARAEHADDDVDTSGWTRTEYVAFDPTPQDDAPRNLVGGSFNPGIASQHGRQYPSASIANSPIKTRSGAQARFAQESRQAPRSDRVASPTPKSEPVLSGAHYDKPAVIPMLAPSAAPAVAARPPARMRARSSEPAKFVLAAALGAAVVLAGGALAWKSGLLSGTSPSNAALVTPAVAAQAEAARVRSEAQDVPVAAPAGLPPQRSDAEVDAALAAAARAAAVPTASVRAASPARVAVPLPPGAAPAASTAQRSAPLSKESVADAIAKAQARADRFLSTGSKAGPAAASAPE
ncbi:hypothetical protein [Scleromatobacter humisilvae]|uniref:Uncharacterized protein n=1 Tax=Scleromatobacter humisilvae TaxID=2897159 RepID=A0A9X1YJF9_9BURK|nr:hypothetical protein [Scleromatobacter humisilvae]MCK9685990.1 hypothetical protein [Scleromatobacter humisilvae]